MNVTLTTLMDGRVWFLRILTPVGVGQKLGVEE
jgi:hypothetical protein